MKKKLDSFYLEYMGWIKTKNHLTLLSLKEPTSTQNYAYQLSSTASIKNSRFYRVDKKYPHKKIYFKRKFHVWKSG